METLRGGCEGRTVSQTHSDYEDRVYRMSFVQRFSTFIM